MLDDTSGALTEQLGPDAAAVAFVNMFTAPRPSHARPHLPTEPSSGTSVSTYHGAAGPQALLRRLPDTNRLKTNRRMSSRRVQQGDLSTLSDLLAHNCDHAYTVASLLELLAESDLQALALAEPSRYEVPAEAAEDLAPLTSRIRDPWQLAHFAELLRGDIFMHLFWAAHADTPRAEPVVLPETVLCPVWRLVGYRVALADAERSKCLARDELAARVPTTCALYLDGVQYAGLPCPGVPLLERLDCATPAGDLAAGLARDLRVAAPGGAAATEEEALRVVAETYRALSRAGQQQVFLHRRGFRLRREPWREKRVPRVVVQRDWDAVARADGAPSPPHDGPVGDDTEL